MKKFFVIILVLAILPAIANAEKVLKPIGKTTGAPVGGKDATGEMQILNVNPDGSINVIMEAPPGSEINTGIVTIPNAGPADRTQMPELSATACTLQAFTDNIGSIYVGGDNVTNKSGNARGMELAPGMPYNNVSVINLNLIYVATDTAGNKVAYLCN